MNIHGGNNSFTECLYFGKPALIMPYVWDGHDNATRVQETGHGLKLSRYDWTDAEQSQRKMMKLLNRGHHGWDPMHIRISKLTSNR